MKMICFAFTVMTGLLLSACDSTPINNGVYEKAVLESSSEAYQALGISENEIHIREDGMRTDGKEGSYEWWYTDAEFHDGTTAVVVFYTKNIFDVPGPARPTATIDIQRPDGTRIKRTIFEQEGTVINSSKEFADVRILDSYLKYVDGHYELYFNDEDIEFDIKMESILPMWRPDTAHWYFGDDKEHFFAWFVAQPSSKISGTLKTSNEEVHLEGTGYHDHNWGNIPMNEVINHWYWGRAKVGEYDVIAVDIISDEKTGFTRLPVFMIAKNGVILDDDQSRTDVIREDTIMHPVTGKFYDNRLKYIQNSEDGTTYTLEMVRQKDIETHSFLDELPFMKKTIAKILGKNPTYIRSLGDVVLTIEKEGVKEIYHQEGLWEQMFFGSNKDAYIWN